MASDTGSNSGGFKTALGHLFFWGFVVVKVSGHIFASWSWWWVLLPVVPWIGEIVVKYWGL